MLTEMTEIKNLLKQKKLVSEKVYAHQLKH